MFLNETWFSIFPQKLTEEFEITKCCQVNIVRRRFGLIKVILKEIKHKVDSDIKMSSFKRIKRRLREETSQTWNLILS